MLRVGGPGGRHRCSRRDARLSTGGTQRAGGPDLVSGRLISRPPAYYNSHRSPPERGGHSWLRKSLDGAFQGFLAGRAERGSLPLAAPGIQDPPLDLDYRGKARALPRMRGLVGVEKAPFRRGVELLRTAHEVPIPAKVAAARRADSPRFCTLRW